MGPEFEENGAGSLLYTNVDMEGLQRGICPGPVKALIDTVRIPVYVAGGISSMEDMRVLEIGVYGAGPGSSLYREGSLREHWRQRMRKAEEQKRRPARRFHWILMVAARC